MDSIKQDLEQKRRALTATIQASLGGHTRNVDEREMAKDPYGSASLVHDEEMVVDMAARRVRELQAIDRALDDIDAGRYGICQECEEPIAKARLKALPFAIRCVACQAKAEGPVLRRAA
jgi:RNA polymerase-binding transcription factor